MVQSWENFMDPSGGNMSNKFIDGSGSLLLDLGVGIGVDWFGRSGLDSLEKRDIRLLGSRVAKARSFLHGKGIYKESAIEGIYEGRDPRQHGKAISKSVRANIGRIKAGYTGVRANIRSIGLAYMFTAGASIMEAMATPGISTSAQMSDLKAFGEQPIDSGMAYTQRQRALMAIHDSQMGIRNVIGHEARHFHR